MFAQWKWNGNILGNNNYNWQVLYSDTGEFIVNDTNIKLSAYDSAGEWGDHGIAYTQVDLTNCQSLVVTAECVQTGAYYCKSKVWLQKDIPQVIPETNWGEPSADYLYWQSDNSDSAGTKVLDVSGLSGYYYLCIGKWHWPGYINITNLYFNTSSVLQLGLDSFEESSSNKVIVRLDPCDGFTIPTEISVDYNKPYGDLPKPPVNNSTFVGWYTAPIGGEMITKTSIVQNLNPHTLYAHWQ